jgi:hypothetical protein
VDNASDGECDHVDRYVSCPAFQLVHVPVLMPAWEHARSVHWCVQGSGV